MDAGTKLTPDQLASLVPGDAVTIEAGADFGRTRPTAGIVTRVTDTKAFVIVQSARGVACVQEFSLRNGWRVGRAAYGALVTQLGRVRRATTQSASSSASMPCGAPGPAIGPTLMHYA